MKTEKDKRIEELLSRIAALEARLAAAESWIATLTARPIVPMPSLTIETRPRPSHVPMGDPMLCGW